MNDKRFSRWEPTFTKPRSTEFTGVKPCPWARWDEDHLIEEETKAQESEKPAQVYKSGNRELHPSSQGRKCRGPDFGPDVNHLYAHVFYTSVHILSSLSGTLWNLSFHCHTNHVSTKQSIQVPSQLLLLPAKSCWLHEIPNAAFSPLSPLPLIYFYSHFCTHKIILPK